MHEEVPRSIMMMISDVPHVRKPTIDSKGVCGEPQNPELLLVVLVREAIRTSGGVPAERALRDVSGRCLVGKVVGAKLWRLPEVLV